VISRYIATVDQKSLGLHVSVFISIKLARQKEEDLDRFASAISKWDEVLECYLMTGNRDYLLRVVAADLSSYEAFLKNKLTRLDGIASIESSFALSQVKYSNRAAGVRQRFSPRSERLLRASPHRNFRRSNTRHHCPSQLLAAERKIREIYALF